MASAPAFKPLSDSSDHASAAIPSGDGIKCLVLREGFLLAPTRSPGAAHRRFAGSRLSRPSNPLLWTKELSLSFG